MAIYNIDLNEPTQGIQDDFGNQETKANSLGKQIFWKYGYNPIKTLNNNDDLFSGGLEYLLDGTDNGVDDVIYLSKIPKDDPFKLKQLKKGRWDDICYTIDYKSNNFDGGSDSVYVKLMPYRGYKAYEHKHRDTDQDKMDYYSRLDFKKYNKARLKNKKVPKSYMEKFYGNNQLLGDNNRTDYFLYLQYDDELESKYILDKAYLVPAEQLRHQVIGILNEILKKGGYTHQINLRKDGTFLNHKITRALKICQESPELVKPEILKPPMDLFKPRYKKDIILRIPDKYLTDHIQFNYDGR